MPIDLDLIVEAQSVMEASRIRADRLAALERERPEAQPRERLKTYAASWLRSKLPTLKPATRAHYAEVLDNHVLPTLGDYFLDAITIDDLVSWRDAQAARVVPTSNGKTKPTSRATVNSRLRVLKAVVRDAVDDYGLERDPTRRVAALREVRGDDDRNCLTAEELRRVLAAAEQLTSQWYPFFFVLAFGGMRFGEATALRWSDIDERAGRIWIKRAQWKGHEDTTKTGSIRSVPLCPELSAVLRSHREKQRAAQVRRARRQRVADIEAAMAGFVFPGRAGSLMHNTAPRKALAKCLTHAGIAHRFTVHGFRRTFTNLLRQVSQDAVVIRSMTGHATEEMREHYSHVEVDEKRTAVAGLLRLVHSASSP